MYMENESELQILASWFQIGGLRGYWDWGLTFTETRNWSPVGFYQCFIKNNLSSWNSVISHWFQLLYFWEVFVGRGTGASIQLATLNTFWEYGRILMAGFLVPFPETKLPGSWCRCPHFPPVPDQIIWASAGPLEGLRGWHTEPFRPSLQTAEQQPPPTRCKTDALKPNF